MLQSIARNSTVWSCSSGGGGVTQRSKTFSANSSTTRPYSIIGGRQMLLGYRISRRPWCIDPLAPALHINITSHRSRDVSLNCTNSGDGSDRVDHHHRITATPLRLLDIIAFVWSLPHIISDFLKKEEKFADKLEEEIEEMANIVKVGAKVIAEIAETVEKVAKEVEADAEKVDNLMDKVKEKTKVAHDELEEAVEKLDEAVQEIDKVEKQIEKKSKVKARDADGGQVDEPIAAAAAAATSQQVQVKASRFDDDINGGSTLIISQPKKFLASLLHVLLNSIKLLYTTPQWSTLRVGLGFCLGLWILFQIFVLTDLSIIL